MSEIDRIETLLDRLHRALIAADFAALGQIAPDLTTALGALAPDTDRRALDRLRRKADRNAASALAAGRGVRAALRRLQDIRQAAGGLVTYDRSGRRSEADSNDRLTRRY